MSMSTPEQKKQNLKLALVLASVAVVFFVGFLTKAALFGI
jgi:formate hydrogenlyase subunit 3/multisubunit Na+/H+ antiporter MnhD subunit